MLIVFGLILSLINILAIQPIKKDMKRPSNNTAHIPPLLLFLANRITPNNQPIKKIAMQSNKSIVIILYFTDFRNLQQQYHSLNKYFGGLFYKKLLK